MISIKGLRKSFRILSPTSASKGFMRKSYEDYVVFDGVDLEVRKGDILGILGRNGCGKSTFMKIISGIIEPDEGTVETKGKVASILELSMGFHGDLTGRENIMLRSELYGIPREEVRKNLDRIVEYCDLGVFIDNPVRTYSSGMRSRLAFSIMISIDADVFLVDEALSTGDLAFASKASEHLKNLVRSGKTVLFTSHSLNTIKNTCNRAIWLNDHRIAMDGPADEVCDEYARSITDSFEETKSLAEGGSSAAQYRMSSFYRDGVHVDKDVEQQRLWLEAAAAREHPMAMADLASMVASDDPARAASLYRAAAEKGNSDARRKYAMLAAGSEESLEPLRSALLELAGSGYPYDLFNYGDFLQRAAVRDDERREAFDYVSRASSEGWIDADLLLARMLREGFGTERDLEASLRVLESAADKGSGRAMTALADTFYDGKGIRKDHAKAFQWYLRSAMTGNPRSQYQVAAMLSAGDGVEKDEEAAAQWYARSASASVDDLRARAMEAIRSRNGPEDKRIDGMLKESSLCFNVKSMSRMASRYESGKGFKKNPRAALSMMEKAAAGQGAPRTRLALRILEDAGDADKAIQLLRDAAAAGDSRAMMALGRMHVDGVQMKKDVVAYRSYVRMAAENGDREAIELLKKWNARKKH